MVLRGGDGDWLVGWVTPKGLLGRRPCWWVRGSGSRERVSEVPVVVGWRCRVLWEAGAIREAQHSPKRFRASMLGGESKNGGQEGL